MPMSHSPSDPWGFGGSNQPIACFSGIRSKRPLDSTSCRDPEANQSNDVMHSDAKRVCFGSHDLTNVHQNTPMNEELPGCLKDPFSSSSSPLSSYSTENNHNERAQLSSSSSLPLNPTSQYLPSMVDGYHNSFNNGYRQNRANYDIAQGHHHHDMLSYFRERARNNELVTQALREGRHYKTNTTNTSTSNDNNNNNDNTHDDRVNKTCNGLSSIDETMMEDDDNTSSSSNTNRNISNNNNDSNNYKLPQRRRYTLEETLRILDEGSVEPFELYDDDKLEESPSEQIAMESDMEPTEESSSISSSTSTTTEVDIQNSTVSSSTSSSKNNSDVYCGFSSCMGLRPSPVSGRSFCHCYASWRGMYGMEGDYFSDYY